MTAKNNKEESIRVIKPMEYLWLAGCIFFISIYPFMLMPYGLDFKDSFFHLTGYTGQRTGSVGGTDFMTFLSPLSGKVWLQFAPNSVISLRIMATIQWIFMQLIPIGVVLSMVEAKRRTIVCLIALGVVLAVAVPYLPGYDLDAGFWGGLLFAASVAYLWHGRWIRLLLVGVLAAAFVGTRFPGIVILGPLFLVVAVKSWQEGEKIQYLIFRPVFLLFSFGTAYFFFYLTFGSNTYQGSIIESINLYFRQLFGINLQNNGSHSLINLVNNYLRDGKKMLVMLSVLLGYVALWKLAAAKLTKPGFILAVLTGIFCYYIWKNLTGSPYSWNYSLFASTFSWMAFGVMTFLAWWHGKKEWVLVGFLGFSFGIISALGSNTGFLKMLGSYSFVLPIFLWFIWNYVNDSERNLVLLLSVILALFACSEFLVFGSRNEDDRWYRLNAEVNHPQLRGIKTSEARKVVLQEILGHISTIKASEPGTSLVYHGKFAWIFRYLDKDAAFYESKTTMLYDDPGETKLLADHLAGLRSRHFVVLVFGYPEYPQPLDNALVGEMLRERQYQLYAEGVNYQIFASAVAE